MVFQMADDEYTAKIRVGNLLFCCNLTASQMTEIATKKENSTIIKALQQGPNSGMVVGAFQEVVSIMEATPIAKKEISPEGGQTGNQEVL